MKSSLLCIQLEIEHSGIPFIVQCSCMDLCIYCMCMESERRANEGRKERNWVWEEVAAGNNNIHRNLFSFFFPTNIRSKFLRLFSLHVNSSWSSNGIFRSTYACRFLVSAFGTSNRNARRTRTFRMIGYMGIFVVFAFNWKQKFKWNSAHGFSCRKFEFLYLNFRHENVWMYTLATQGDT